MLFQCPLTCHVARFVFVSECITAMVDHLSSSILSLLGNAIGDKGAIALAAAMKTATNLHKLE